MAENEQEIEIDRPHPIDITHAAEELKHYKLIWPRMDVTELLQNITENKDFRDLAVLPEGHFPGQGYVMPVKFPLPEIYQWEDSAGRTVTSVRSSFHVLEELIVGEYTERKSDKPESVKSNIQEFSLTIHGIVHPNEEGQNPHLFSKYTGNVERAKIVPIYTLFRNLPGMNRQVTLRGHTENQNIL